MAKRTMVVALFGKSGAGKDTVQKFVLDSHVADHFHRIVSCTTRPMRDNETDGVDYHFITREVFTRKLLDNHFIEALEFNNWFYGALVDDLDPDKVNLGIFTPSGIDALLETADVHNIDVLPIYIKCNAKTRLLRALNREENPDVAEIIRRYQADEDDFACIDFEHATIRNDADWMTEAAFVEIIDSYCQDFFD